MALLDEVDWDSKIFSNGWVSAKGGVLNSTEPATGATLATVGSANAADVAAAAAGARAAQPEWAASVGMRSSQDQDAGEWEDNCEEIAEVAREDDAGHVRDEEEHHEVEQQVDCHSERRLAGAIESFQLPNHDAVGGHPVERPP